MIKLPCKDEPLLRILRDFLGANALKVPEERIKLLSVIEKSGSIYKLRGNLYNLLNSDDGLDISEEDFENTKVSNICGKKSRKANIEIGMPIFEGFLSGFGVSNFGINAQFEDVSSISFSFEDVTRIYIDNGLLGRKLKSYQLDKSNSANLGFFRKGKEKSTFLLIDSIITSNNFTVNIEETSNKNFQLNIEELKRAVSNAKQKVSVEFLNKMSVTFRCKKALPFAFSCIKFELDDNGKILGMPTFTKSISKVFGEADGESIKEMLYEGNALFEIDNSESIC